MHKVVVEHNIVDSMELHQVEGAGLKHTLVEVVLVQEASVVDVAEMLQLAALKWVWLQVAAQGVWLQVAAQVV